MNLKAIEVIPTTVLTGFLGSGKTTLLKRLLADPAMAGTAVIINEFGEVGLDDALIEKVEEDAVLLPSGCVCCAVRGDLVQAMERLHQRWQWGEIPAIKRVVLETTGLADPTPIVHTLMTEENLYRVYQLDGVVTTVDGQFGRRQLEEHSESVKQVALADRIVITKADLVQEAELQALHRTLRALNRSAPIRRVVKGDVAVAELIGIGAHEPALAGADPERWLAADRYGATAEHGPECGPDCSDAGHHHSHHHGHASADHHHHHDPDAAGAGSDHAHAEPHPQHLHGIHAFCLTFTEPLVGGDMSSALQLLAQLYGERLLRVKGILNIKGQSKPFIVHGVQHVFYPPDTLERWPSADRRSRLVLITRDLPEASVRKHFRPFIGEADGPEQSVTAGKDGAV